MPACWWKKTAVWRRRSRRRTSPHSAGRLMRSTPQIPPESMGQPFETTGMGRQNSSNRRGMAGPCETAPGHATRIEYSTWQTAELLLLPRAMPTQPVSNMLSNEMDESDTRQKVMQLRCIVWMQGKGQAQWVTTNVFSLPHTP